jgi:hypothetical protein
MKLYQRAAVLALRIAFESFVLQEGPKKEAKRLV